MKRILIVLLLCGMAVIAKANDKVVSSDTVSAANSSLKQQIGAKWNAVLKAKAIYDLNPSISNGKNILMAMDDYLAFLEKIDRGLAHLIESLEKSEGSRGA